MEQAAEHPKQHGSGKRMYILAAAVAIVIIAGVAVEASGALSPSVAVGDNISVYYTGTFTNGTVFSSNVGGALLNFTVGAGEIIPGFDQGVVGVKLGSNKTITVPPNEGYGYVNQSLIVQLPSSQFKNLSIHVGSVVTSTSGRQALVTAMNATNVTVDFNSPLAGQTLIFHVKVVSIKS